MKNQNNPSKNLTQEMDYYIDYYPGNALPLGANITDGAVQFSIFSQNAKKVWLELYAEELDTEPRHTIALSPDRFRTGDYWHVTVKGIGAGQLYLYRMEGDFDPEKGMRYVPSQVLIDPYSRAVAAKTLWSSARVQAGVPKSIVVDNSFDWQGDRPLNYPLSSTIIYEAHAKGYTIHASSKRQGVRSPGTFRGIIEMIPYLKSLGITSLELLPIQEFNELEYNYKRNPLTGEPLRNYWGYSTLAFFAPKSSYAQTNIRGAQVQEFKEMVRELHKAGIEVILDIVFNHTGENDAQGKTYSFRGIDNAVYYMLEDDKRLYKNYSGCGNTMNCNHPIMRSFILDALHYWVQEMHVDGFRFDLAPILARGEDGAIRYENSVLDYISQDPLLKNTKIIAEAWDAAGAYQVGELQGRWCEWNDRFRDDVKRFWIGYEHSLSAFATRIAGSSDLYANKGRSSLHSINYITSHDGFTLNDLVSYSRKHNEANGEGNRDGHNSEYSFNFGVEGESENADIEALRTRMVKNFLASILVSQGTPMILGGDEMRRSQNGNNNAYCQDNETNWLNHDLLNAHGSIYSFLQSAISFRKTFLAGNVRKIQWFNEMGSEPNWDSRENALAMLMQIENTGEREHTDQSASKNSKYLYIIFNASSQDKKFVLPRISLFESDESNSKNNISYEGNTPTQEQEQPQQWHVILDTAKVENITTPCSIQHGIYRAQSKSLVMLNHFN